MEGLFRGFRICSFALFFCEADSDVSLLQKYGLNSWLVRSTFFSQQSRASFDDLNVEQFSISSLIVMIFFVSLVVGRSTLLKSRKCLVVLPPVLPRSYCIPDPNSQSRDQKIFYLLECCKISTSIKCVYEQMSSDSKSTAI